ncbi:MAG: hypothetical protein JST04_02585 [Bdellovibrionales bacterium]|nr:hypothetical protein [Bdellovibrionales bacterium]
MHFPRRFLPILLGLVSLVLAAKPARAWDLSVVNGFNFSHPSYNPDLPNNGTSTTKAAFEFGALAGFAIGGDYFFDAGAIRHTRHTIVEDTVATTDSRYSGWLFPMGVRFMRAEFFGFGFGPYFALLNSRTRTEATYAAGGGGTTDADDPNRKNFEMGLHVNLRLAFPVMRTAKVIFDGSYLFGFTDLNKAGTAEDKTQELLLLVGFQIPIGGASEAASSDTNPAPSAPGDLAPAVTPMPSPSPAPTAKPAVKKKKEKRK